MPVFESVDELKRALIANDPGDFFDQFIVNQETDAFPRNRMEFVAEVMQNEYGVAINPQEMLIVGSSKLGFATHKKIRDRVEVGQAYRSFGENSDIDLSICSPALFKILWHEISAYFNTMPHMPYRHKKLGEYLAYGWLRQDHLPMNAAPHLVKCSNLRIARGIIRNDNKRGHPMLDMGIFYDIEHLKMYQSRSILLSKRNLEMPL